MARNGTGTYNLPAGQPVVTNTTISSSVFNTLTSDIATALTQSICTDGQTPMAANLPMGGNKITNLAAGSASTEAVNYGQLTTGLTNVQSAPQGRNLLLNGKMDIAQRASSFALTTAATIGSLDRWYGLMPTSAAGVLARNTAPAASGFNNFAKLQRNNGSSLTNALSMWQAVETSKSIQCAGKTAIISFTAYIGANFSGGGTVEVIVRTGTGTDQSTVLLSTGGWTGAATPLSVSETGLTTTPTRFSRSFSVASSATQIGVGFRFTPTGTAGADDALYITGVQLEVAYNSSTTPSTFEWLSPTQDLNECKRFYQTATINVIGSSAGAHDLSSNTVYPITMRAAPTVTQITNNYQYAQANVTTTTSVYVTTVDATLAYRRASGVGATQFSEFTSFAAEL